MSTEASVGFFRCAEKTSGGENQCVDGRSDLTAVMEYRHCVRVRTVPGGNGREGKAMSPETMCGRARAALSRNSVSFALLSRRLALFIPARENSKHKREKVKGKILIAEEPSLDLSSSVPSLLLLF